jgi:hypothetical protein
MISTVNALGRHFGLFYKNEELVACDECWVVGYLSCGLNSAGMKNFIRRGKRQLS